MLGHWDVSTMAFTCIVITVNLRLLMTCSRITKWHQLSVGGSILAWFLFIFVYSFFFTNKVIYKYVAFFILNTLFSHWIFFSFSSCAFQLAGYFLHHLCVDEYILFLSHNFSCSHCCATWRILIPRVRLLKLKAFPLRCHFPLPEVRGFVMKMLFFDSYDWLG